VAGGHYSVPRYPEITGIETFPGLKFHTHNFRRLDPEIYSDKNIMIIGARLSSFDMFEMLID
jgi:cation diffusion facilitator CzcD-associated flavoprotein CzcO